jgi:hypothetical protein
MCVYGPYRPMYHCLYTPPSRVGRILRNYSYLQSRLENEGNERCKRPLSIMLGSLIFKEVFL